MVRSRKGWEREVISKVSLMEGRRVLKVLKKRAAEMGVLENREYVVDKAAE
jgi:hypothetical protein